jgi:hypothetical protein
MSVLMSVACKRADRAVVFADYLKEEKKLRGRVTNEESLQDSINELREKYGIDRQVAMRQLSEKPTQWIDLLRKLRDDR